MAAGAYTFGDSELAGARLALLARVFAATTEPFVERLGALRPAGGCGLVVDLGCGPGHTTALLGARLSPALRRLIGIDASAEFAAQAADRLGDCAQVICGDVTALPADVDAVDLAFARMLLTHLPDPAAAMAHWLARLAPGGLIAVEEVESIATDEPVLAEYLALQREMLAANRQRLEIGPLIEASVRGAGARVVSNETATLTPATADAARMFAMNFAGWRGRPDVTAQASPQRLEQIAAGLERLAGGDGPSPAPIHWTLRQLVATG